MEANVQRLRQPSVRKAQISKKNFIYTFGFRNSNRISVEASCIQEAEMKVHACASLLWIDPKY